MPAKFWMVLGVSAPTYRHQSAKSAQVEAERLAALNPGSSFTVLEAIATVRRSEFQWEKLADINERPEDIPF